VPDAIERLLREFNEQHEPGENLRRFFARHSNEQIRGWLAGEIVAAVERDAAAGPVPMGVEG
jgi:sulfite reductase (ferredoxin)